jgi:hypothetical protein
MPGNKPPADPRPTPGARGRVAAIQTGPASRSTPGRSPIDKVAGTRPRIGGAVRRLVGARVPGSSSSWHCWRGPALGGVGPGRDFIKPVTRGELRGASPLRDADPASSHDSRRGRCPSTPRADRFPWFRGVVRTDPSRSPPAPNRVGDRRPNRDGPEAFEGCFAQWFAIK